MPPVRLAPFRVNIFGPDLAPWFPISSFQSCSATLRHLAKSTGTLTVDLTHPRAEQLFTAGARATVDYFVGLAGASYADPANWVRLINGPLQTLQAQGPFRTGNVTFGIEDDYGILGAALAWPKPSAALSAQIVAADVQTGPAETVIKHYVQANAVTRLGLPGLSVAADLGRGPTVTASARFTLLSDLLPDLARQAGFGLRFTQTGSSRVFDVYSVTDRSARPLTEASGVVNDWTLLRGGPDCTRAVVGGSGAGTARVFGSSANTALETEWGQVVEAFGEDTATNVLATLNADAATLVAASPATAGFTVDIQEGPAFRFGRNMFVGDTIAVEISPNLSVTDALTQASVSWSVESGLSISPQVGDTSVSQGPNAVLAAAISRIAKGLRAGRSGK